MSLLGRQRVLLGAQGFSEKYSNAWIVWEPGPWTAAETVSEESAAATRAPVTEAPNARSGGDALCFALPAHPTLGEPLRVGRGTECELTVNDMTVSRENLLLTPEAGGGWRVAPAPGKSASVEGHLIDSDHPVGLSDRASIVIGGVVLTFHDATGFIRRLQSVAQSQFGRTVTS
jgi:hypothetical protein